MRNILLAILLAGAPTLHAAETKPMAIAKYRRDMSAASAKDFTVIGDVKPGVPLQRDEKTASFARGGTEFTLFYQDTKLREQGAP